MIKTFSVTLRLNRSMQSSSTRSTVLRTLMLGVNYSSRFIGSMVADFHRTLLRGGIHLPSQHRFSPGQIASLYEGNPVAFLAEQAGGAASNGSQRLLEVPPREFHQRTPLIVGGELEMAEFERCMRELGFTHDKQ